MFFVPTRFEHVSFSNLPTSLDLRAALRKIGVQNLRDLNGVSTHDFIRVTPDGDALAREVLQLVEQIRNGSLEIEPCNRPTGQLNVRSRKRVEAHKEESGLCISIPDELKHLPVSDLCLSTKLDHLFVATGIIFLGDLHNRRLVEFQNLPTYGKKTIGELLALVNDPTSKLWSLQTDQGKRQRRRTVHFFVPDKVRDLNLSELQLTKRLRSALEKIGATSLGELHGLLNIRLQKLINCSDGTISELVSILNRAKAGEYDSLLTEGVSFGILDFGNLAERVFLEFSSRDQEIISLRWGGKTSGAQSLKNIAKTIGVSRERVRQIEKSWFQRLRIAGGKKLSSLLVRLASEGHQTPPVSVSAVSEAWIAACGKKLAFNISFYSRLLEKLSV